MEKKILNTLILPAATCNKIIMLLLNGDRTCLILVFNYGDILNFMSKVVEFQLWFLYFYDASLVVFSIIM